MAMEDEGREVDAPECFDRTLAVGVRGEDGDGDRMGDDLVELMLLSVWAKEVSYIDTVRHEIVHYELSDDLSDAFGYRAVDCENSETTVSEICCGLLARL